MHRCPKMFVLLMLLLSMPAWALTPPIDETDLMKQADLAIKGQVIGIKCAPQGFEQSTCATTNWYIATMEVNTVKKGRWPGRTIPILFRDVRFLKGCVGDADHVHRVGERGFYYLVSRGDGNWAPINWSAVIVNHPGEGPLPFCQ